MQDLQKTFLMVEDKRLDRQKLMRDARFAGCKKQKKAKCALWSKAKMAKKMRGARREYARFAR